ncbi:MAG: S8 family serine peptidase [Saprospiraceae bacterium]|nr:S8 family serine peptidase [Saprospiraceae bacterium]
MNKLLLLLVCGLMLPATHFAQTAAEKIDPFLQQRMMAAPSEYQEVIIDLADQVDTRAMLARYEASNTPLEVRSFEVITSLQAKAEATQPAFLERLRQLDGIDKSVIHPMWIVNAVFVKANKSAIEQMAKWPEVGMLIWNSPVEMDAVESQAAAAPVPNGSEPGLRAIKAPFLWGLGYTGYGRKGLVIDTGNDGEHPSLIDNFWGHVVPVNQAWAGSGQPEDCADHGTHVTGTVCGLDRRTNDTIGVAFNSHWMGGPMQFPIGEELGCQKAFSQTIISNIATMQWALNPDGNATTTADQPDVVNCSWRSGNFGCGITASVNILNALEAAGIGVVWAQGNNGPGASTVASGAAMNMDLVNTFAVGAVNGANPNFPIADFSSRGPTPCGGTGPLNIKPEVCAPGVNVRSAVPGGGYQSFNGTSMAAPHAAGAMVLLREAFPTLSGIQLKMALYNTAKDLGVAGEDNTYGRGMIDLEATYNYLLNEGHVPVPPVSSERDVVIIDVRVLGTCLGPVVPTITFENASQQTITSLQIKYGIENGTQITHDWTGNLLPNTFTTVTLPGVDGVVPGTYNFITELLNPNGLPDPRPLNNRFRRRFTMANDGYPSATVVAQQAGAVCNGSRVLLEYNGDPLEPAEKVQWFVNSTGILPVGEGNTYLTPALTQSSTYFVSLAASHNTGKPTIPASGNSTTSGGALIFNADQPIIIKSVKIFAEETGGRQFRVVDNAGNIVTSRLVTISQVGEQRVTLNFSIPAGTEYELTFPSTNKGLRQTTNQVSYPYQIPGALNIFRGRLASGIFSSLVYLYFFDWEVEVPSVCGRIAVPLQVGAQNAPTVSFTSSADTVYLSSGGSVSFTDQTMGATAWSWDFGNGQTSTTANPATTYTQTGTFRTRLIVNASNGCSNIAEKDIVVLQTSSTAAPSGMSGRVELFPNPAADEVTLRFLEQMPKNMEISVSDMLGRNTRRFNSANYSDSVVRMDIATLPAGVYIVQVRADDNYFWSGKFVKE